MVVATWTLPFTKNLWFKFFQSFDAYTQEDYFLALESMKQQATVPCYSRELHHASLLVEKMSPLPLSIVIIGIDGLNGYAKTLKLATLDDAIQQAQAYS